MKERKIATKAILLSRVSSKEQEEGYSIDAQKYRLQEYCTRKGLEIVKIFEFAESSTVGNRKKFMEAIDFAKKQKEIIAVVSDKVDRLQRSYKETPLLNDLIEKEKIELHFYTENCIIHKNSTSQERMMWNMFVMMAQNYTDSLKDNVNRAIAQKLREGEWVSTAPIGYLHITGEKHKRGKGAIIIDPDRAALIRKIFEEYATGNYTVAEILEHTKKWGLTNSRGNKGYLCLSHIHSILQNSFYYEVMRVQKTGKTYRHKYPAIITKELFDACSQIRLNRKKKSFKYREKEFIFRGLIICGVTGRIVTSDIKHKTYLNGKTASWTYLLTWNPENPNKKVLVKEERILEEVEKVFASMHLEPELYNKVIEYIKSSSDAEKDYHKRRVSELHSEHTKVKTRMDKLTDLFLDSDISKEEYETKRQQLTGRREDIVREISGHDKADDSFAKMLVSLVELASNALETFKGSNLERKRQLINLVFSNLKLTGEKLDYHLRSPFDMFVKLPENLEWRTREESNP